MIQIRMESSFLNYDQIAGDYNQRYPTSQQWERGRALLDLAKKFKEGNFLEVGSGTGYWLNLLHQITTNLYGFDYSLGMIRQARRQPAPLKLSRGSAVHLPYKNETFDLVYSVDAIHHFGNSHAYIAEAFRVLKPGGALATIGHDPHHGTTDWYIYNYFEGVYDTYLRRYPSEQAVLAQMEEAGFNQLSAQTVEHIKNIHVGESVLRDPFIKHSASSQLALLSEETYQAGLEKIKQAIAEGKQRDEMTVFTSDIQVRMFTGYKPLD
jgi:ubiquinone/menaquinone biosynthesis C-methylase UbiE